MSTLAKRVHKAVERNPSRWTAEVNLRAQEALFTAICINQAESENSIEVVATRLGLPEDQVLEILEGRVNLTLAELRLLSVACDVVVEYSVRSSKTAHGVWISYARRHADKQLKHVEENEIEESLRVSIRAYSGSVSAHYGWTR